MRKIKRTEKRKIKINEKKEIKVTRKPSDEKLNAARLATILINISRVCENHKKIWDNEIAEHDGFIKFDKFMLISQTRASAEKIYNNYFQPEEGEEGEDVENNFFYTEVIGEQAVKCINGVSETPILTLDDINQRLPMGFMATLGSWARMVRDLNTAKMRGIARKLGIKDKELNRVFNFSNKYMEWVYQDISFV
ncbi:hypothetical protein ACW0TN_05385 [Fusobacterium pseudoperiodonticum]